MARFDWSAANGRTVFPVLLVHGMPYAFLPSGYVNAASITFTSPDALWWPGTSVATLAAAASPWLELGGEGFTWTEAANPADSASLDIGAITARIADVDGAATAVFAARDNALGTYITAEVTSSATTVDVVSTTGFAASGTVWIGREAIAYSGVTATQFTGCTRGQYGSEAQRHFYAASAGFGLGNPEVTSAPVEIVGRLATLWLVEQVGTALTALSLQYVGHIGVGPLLPDEGEGWTLQIDHAVKRLAQKPRAGTVQIGGYVHTGNSGARSPVTVDGVTVYGRGVSRDGLTPVLDTFNGTGSGGLDPTRYVITLTGDDAAPDNAGWHATREGFVDALNVAATSVVAAGDSLAYSLTADATLVMDWTFAAARGGTTAWAWGSVPTGVGFPPTTTGQVRGEGMPEAWVPIIGTGSRVYLNDTDYATVPAVPSPAPVGAFCRWALVWDEQVAEGGAPIKRIAYVNSNTSSGGVNYVTVVPVNGSHYLPPTAAVSAGARTIIRRRQGILVTSPTTARVVLYVSSSDWVTALYKAVTVFSDDLADGAAQAFDWGRIADVATRYAPTIRGRREYIVDNDVSVLSLVANECALQGFALVPYQGRIAIARIGEFAATEPRDGTLTSSDTADGSAAPTYSRGADAIVNTMTVDFPSARTKFNFVDQTSRAAYGPSRSTVNVTVPAGLFDRAIDGALMTSTLASVAMSTLGPLRFPYEHVGLTTTLEHADLAVGDLVGLTLWRVPNGTGGRGITDRTAQVMTRAPVLYREGSEGLVRFTLRLQPTNLCGWAPGAFVAALGINSVDVTLDTTTFGANGCAIDGTDGGAASFEVGDKVRLVEVDSASPATAIQRTVASVSGDTVTLTVAPGATWVTLSTDALKVMMLYDDWDVVVDAQLPGWAYLANAAGQLVDGGTSTRARVYGA